MDPAGPRRGRHFATIAVDEDVSSFAGTAEEEEEEDDDDDDDDEVGSSNRG